MAQHTISSSTGCVQKHLARSTRHVTTHTGRDRERCTHQFHAEKPMVPQERLFRRQLISRVPRKKKATASRAPVPRTQPQARNAKRCGKSWACKPGGGGDGRARGEGTHDLFHIFLLDCLMPWPRCRRALTTKRTQRLHVGCATYTRDRDSPKQHQQHRRHQPQKPQAQPWAA